MSKPSRKMSLYHIIISLALMSLSLSASPDLQQGLLHSNSESEQGVGIYCVDGLPENRGMFLMSKKREKILAKIPVPLTSYIGYRLNYLSVKWSESGKVVAIHNCLPKHSRVLIYSIQQDGSSKQVVLPDTIIKDQGEIDELSVVSSGIEPVEWKGDNLLTVNYRFRTKKNGEVKSIKTSIQIDN